MLSDEDKRRIEEEEAYRANARRAAERRPEPLLRRLDTPIRLVLGIGGILAILWFITSLSGNSTSPPVQAAPRSSGPHVDVTITSDPTGATVTLPGGVTGQTPFTANVPVGEDVTYTVAAEEPYPDYSLYKSYSGTLNVTEPQGIDVWLERTTADEQAAMRQAAEERRQAAAEREAAEAAEVARQEMDRLRANIVGGCQILLKRRLKSPSTAKFPGNPYAESNFVHDPDAGFIVYAGQVDSQNSFGAMLRGTFACEYTIANDQIRLIRTP